MTLKRWGSGAGASVEAWYPNVRHRAWGRSAGITLALGSPGLTFVPENLRGLRFGLCHDGLAIPSIPVLSSIGVMTPCWGTVFRVMMVMTLSLGLPRLARR